MQELFGRLSLLDPVASEALKVISFFDTMLENAASVESLVRSAAMLVGATAGLRLGDRVYLFGADGQIVLTPSTIAPAAELAIGDDAAWISRASGRHANDDLVLERLSIAVGISLNRPPSEASVLEGVRLLLAPSGERTSDEVLKAAARLNLSPGLRYRAVATPPGARGTTGSPAVPLRTPWGLAQAAIIEDGFSVEGRSGVGGAVMIHSLPASWEAAVFALRATHADESLHADDLGVIYHLAKHQDDSDEVPDDVLGVASAINAGWTEDELLALAGGESLRSIAAIRGLHHSTVHVKLNALGDRLGFEPASVLGRSRLHIALILWRVRHSHLDHPA